jgi:hypothetical protein
VSVLRTKLNSDLEAMAGRRHASNGKAAVPGNGNGTAHAG